MGPSSSLLATRSASHAWVRRAGACVQKVLTWRLTGMHDGCCGGAELLGCCYVLRGTVMHIAYILSEHIA